MRALPWSTAFIAVAVIATLGLLTWQGSVNGDAAVALLSAIVGGALTHAAGGPKE